MPIGLGVVIRWVSVVTLIWISQTIRRGVSSQRNARNEFTKWRTQRKKRNEHNEMTSSLDRPITAASDDGVCRWHAAKLWQTRATLLKLNLVFIVSCTSCKNRTKIWTTNLAGKRTARFLSAGACVSSSFRTFVACVALAGNPLWWMAHDPSSGIRNVGARRRTWVVCHGLQ